MDMLLQQRVLISIHAAREGGDCIAGCPRNRNALFQSTPPVKAATMADFNKRLDNEFQSTPPVKAATSGKYSTDDKYIISIHAAREGGDAAPTRRGAQQHHFNPRRP